MNTPVRHNPLGALGADDDDQAPAPQPQPRKPKLPKAEAERIAHQHGFSQGAPKEPAPAPAPRRGRRRITGRTHQINIKTTEAAIEKLYKIAEEMRAPLGEVLEQALEALEKVGK